MSTGRRAPRPPPWFPGTVTSPTRRHVLVGVAAAGALAACGAPVVSDPTTPADPGADPTTPDPTDPTTPDPSDPTPDPPLALLADLPLGEPVAVTALGLPLLLVRTGEEDVVGLSAVCPHQGCTVAPGGGALECPCHGSRFTIEGTVTSGPATADLTVVPLRIADGAVHLAASG